MNETCPTVTIQTENGPVRINATDYDPKQHKLVGGSAAPAEDNEDGKVDVSKLKKTGFHDLLIGKNGARGGASKFVLFNDKGERVTADGLDEAGYKEENELMAKVPTIDPLTIKLVETK